jgi:hypothetical protein
MSHRIVQCWTALLTVICLFGLALPAWSQQVPVGGPIAQPGQPQIATPPLPTPPADVLGNYDTFVSFIDSALPRTQARLMFDFAEHIREPSRAEYFQPKGGLPGSPGPPFPETNVNYFQVMMHGEVGIFPTFSTFMETPLTFVDADVNKDPWGLGDISLGCKWAFVNTGSLVTTFQLRATIPTASNSALGTDHVSVEPALLADLHLLDKLNLEGELRYWVPIGGTDFAGNILRYGLGLSYKIPLSDSMFLAPVAEGIGWTVLGGKEMVVDSGNVSIQGAETTIFNIYGGLRLGLGSRASVYAGYGRALTGPDWYRDIFRLEVRFIF